MNKEYLMIIDKSVMDEYGVYYKKLHPKSRKHPFANKAGNISPIPPSLNTWMILLRQQMNFEKQKWKDFAIWLTEKYKLSNLLLDKVMVTYSFYMPTQRKFDLDNMTPKFINDGFVEAGLFVDDNITCITQIILQGGFDKNNPRTEILIKKN